jgi:hypothetical protein
VRVCVKRKEQEACEQSRKGNKLQEKTAAFNEFIVAVTSLPNSLSAGEVLETYRRRRQLGVHFKRLKSIPGPGASLRKIRLRRRG